MFTEGRERRCAAGDLAGSLRRLIAPPGCLGCGRISIAEAGEGLCSRCRAAMARPALATERPPGLDRLVSVCSYSGPARHLVAAVKSGRIQAAAETVAELCTERLAPPPGPGVVVVPVPAGPLRAIRRGDDPALAIASALGSRLERPVRPLLVRRDRRRQAGRSRRDRLARPPRIGVTEPAPEAALLVDDVITTGATLTAAALALRAGGTRSVSAVTFAATPPPGRSA